MSAPTRAAIPQDDVALAPILSYTSLPCFEQDHRKSILAPHCHNLRLMHIYPIDFSANIKQQANQSRPFHRSRLYFSYYLVEVPKHAVPDSRIRLHLNSVPYDTVVEAGRSTSSELTQTVTDAHIPNRRPFRKHPWSRRTNRLFSIHLAFVEETLPGCTWSI